MTRPTLPRRDARAGRTWVILVAVLAAAAVGTAVGLFARDLVFKGKNGGSKDEQRSGSAPAERVTALGRLQPAGGVIPVYGPPADRIARLYPKDGQPIGPGTMLKEGDPIADLFSKAQREMEVEVARKQLAESEAGLKAAEAAGKKKIEAAEADRDQLLANRKNDLAALQAKIDYLAEAVTAAEGGVSRLEMLRADGVRVADEDLEKARLARAQAKAEHTAAVAAYKKAETSYVEGEKAANAKIAAAKADLEEAVKKAPIESARERVKLAEHMAGLTTLRAPVTGTVLRVTGREGQPTGMDPILQMAALGEMVAVAEVYESDLERLSGLLAKGPVAAEVTSPSLPGDHTLRGRVGSQQDVNRMIARNQVFAVGPREDADRRVVE
ncbi:MAG TPA: hypothetical protein VKE74_34345, partial [Gemmataceae bacterium]|nr:hypothetical protein [Gemmataceae bacterium]